MNEDILELVETMQDRFDRFAVVRQQEKNNTNQALAQRLLIEIDACFKLIKRRLEDTESEFERSEKPEAEGSEYRFCAQRITGEVLVIDGLPVSKAQLDEDTYIFQLLDDEATATDLESLADILKKMSDAGTIKGNVLLLPSDVIITKAKLVKP